MRLNLGLLLFAIGCGPTVVVTQGETGNVDDPPPGAMTNAPMPSSSSTSPPATTTPIPPATTIDTTFGDSSTTSQPNPSGVSNFISHDDGPWGPDECSTFAQDCLEGEKCMPWANDGGEEWNATRCSPIHSDPNLVGEPCTVEGSTYSGVDDCELGAKCFFVNPETNEGICVALCGGDPDDPVCDGINTCVANETEVLTVCVEECDPTAEACSTGNQCSPGLSRFLCTHHPPGAGAYGETCEPFGCDAGLSCRDPAEVSPLCDGKAEGCCTTYCDVDGAPCPEVEQSCEAYYGAGEAAEGSEHIGLCVTA